ncbi:MAG: hypothetical protein AAB885_02035 [Patescibacteria group bacterium]
MVNNTTTQSSILHPLRTAFEKLPQPIQEWLTSVQVTNVIIEMNKQLNMVGDLVKIIPNYLILRLVVGDLKPENFVKEFLDELDIDESEAIKLTTEIYQKILKPIEPSLRSSVNVDVAKLFTANLASQSIPRIVPALPRPTKPEMVRPNSPQMIQPFSELKTNPSQMVRPSSPQVFKIPNIGSIPTHDDEPKKVHYSNMKTILKDKI